MTSLSPSQNRPKAQSFHFAKELWEKRESVNSPQKATKNKLAMKLASDSNDAISVPTFESKAVVPYLRSESLPYPSKTSAQTNGSAHSNSLETTTRTASKKNKPSSSLKKAVSFGDACTHEVEVVYKIEDMDNIWWSVRDYTEIKKEYETVLFLMETGKPVCELEYSVRGLDKRTETGAWNLYEKQRNARNAVLIEQDKQRKSKIFCQEKIAKAYLREVESTRQEAIEQAAKDAAEVEEYMKSMNKVTNEQDSLPDTKCSSPCTVALPTKGGKKFTGRTKDAFEMFCNSSVDFAKRHHKTSAISSNDNFSKILDLVSIDKGDQKKVRFDPEIKFIKTKKVNDLLRDKQRRWLSKSDLNMIETSFSETIEKMEKGYHISEDDETKRGLEKSTEDGSWKLYERRRDAMDVVLVLQDHQQKHGIIDEVEIAKAYRDACKAARKEAVRFGKFDAKEAKKHRLRIKTDAQLPGRSSSSESMSDVSRDSCDEISRDSGDEMDHYFLCKREKRRRPIIFPLQDASESTSNIAEDRCNDEFTEREDSTHNPGDGEDLALPSTDDVPVNRQQKQRPKLRRRLSKSHAPSKRSIFNEIESEKCPVKSTTIKPEHFVWSRKRDNDNSESGKSSVFEDIVQDVVQAPELYEPTDLEIENVNHVFASIDTDGENDRASLCEEKKIPSNASNTVKQCVLAEAIEQNKLQENAEHDSLEQVEASSNGNSAIINVGHLKKLIEGKLNLKTRENDKSDLERVKETILDEHEDFKTTRNDPQVKHIDEGATGSACISQPSRNGQETDSPCTNRERTENSNIIETDTLCPDANNDSKCERSSENVEMNLEPSSPEGKSGKVESNTMIMTANSSPSATYDEKNEMVWFKVKRCDIVKIEVEEGRTIYILNGAEICTP